MRLVLASVTQSSFTKGYKQQNTQEIFQIHSIIKDTSPVTYKLNDLSGKIIEGSFYKQELVETTKPDFYLIKDVIKSKIINKKKHYFVSWLGYDQSNNSWIESNAIYNFKKKTKNKKPPLASQYCDFILFSKSKDTKTVQNVVKSLPNTVINALSEVILNGFCGNIPLNPSDIEKLKPYKKLMKLLSNKSVHVSQRKKLMCSKRGGSLLSILIPLAVSTIASLIKIK